MTVYCDACDHVHPQGKPKEPWSWRCMRAPASPGYHFVSHNYSPDPPYHLCRFVNTNGECEMFEPKREAPEEQAA